MLNINLLVTSYKLHAAAAQMAYAECRKRRLLFAILSLGRMALAGECWIISDRRMVGCIRSCTVGKDQRFLFRYRAVQTGEYISAD